jgi:hypothetical protein
MKLRFLLLVTALAFSIALQDGDVAALIKV